jgi:hypothetical protein
LIFIPAYAHFFVDSLDVSFFLNKYFLLFLPVSSAMKNGNKKTILNVHSVGKEKKRESRLKLLLASSVHKRQRRATQKERDEMKLLLFFFCGSDAQRLCFLSITI